MDGLTAVQYYWLAQIHRGYEFQESCALILCGYSECAPCSHEHHVMDFAALLDGYYNIITGELAFHVYHVTNFVYPI